MRGFQGEVEEEVGEVEEEVALAVAIALHGTIGVHHQTGEHIQEDGRTHLEAVHVVGGGCQWQDLIIRFNNPCSFCKFNLSGGFLSSRL